MRITPPVPLAPPMGQARYCQARSAGTGRAVAVAVPGMQSAEPQGARSDAWNERSLALIVCRCEGWDPFARWSKHAGAGPRA